MKIFGKKNPDEVEVITEEEKAEKKAKVKKVFITIGKTIVCVAGGAACVLLALACAGDMTAKLSEEPEPNNEDTIEGTCEEVSEEVSEE